MLPRTTIYTAHMHFVLASRISLAGAGVLALSACGGAPRGAASDDAHDASAPPDGQPPVPDSGVGDALADRTMPDDAAASCGPGAIATMPSPYGMPWGSFPSDDEGFTMELNAALPDGTFSRFIAAFDLPGGSYRSLLTLVGSDTVGETMLGDATNVYFF